MGRTGNPNPATEAARISLAHLVRSQSVRRMRKTQSCSRKSLATARRASWAAEARRDSRNPLGKLGFGPNSTIGNPAGSCMRAYRTRIRAARQTGCRELCAKVAGTILIRYLPDSEGRARESRELVADPHLRGLEDRRRKDASALVATARDDADATIAIRRTCLRAIRTTPASRRERRNASRPEPPAGHRAHHLRPAQCDAPDGRPS